MCDLHEEFISNAKQKFSRWADYSQIKPSDRRSLLSGIEKIPVELEKRNNWYECIGVVLDNSSGMRINIRRDGFSAFGTDRGIIINSIVPGWGFGWRPTFKNDIVYNVLSWFMHYSRQYIHRSNVVKVLVHINQRTGKVLHPFGSIGHQQRFSDVNPMISIDVALADAKRELSKKYNTSSNLRNAKLSIPAWVRRNTLNPFIHQAAFHFLRANNLSSSGFSIEAVVAYDCVVQAVASGFRYLNRSNLDMSRDQVCQALNLGADHSAASEYAYFLRNNFGAHAGGWRWWDQDEHIGEDTLGMIRETSYRILQSAADNASFSALVNPGSLSWSSWFMKNFDLLWDAVWTEKAEKWHHESEKYSR